MMLYELGCFPNWDILKHSNNIKVIIMAILLNILNFYKKMSISQTSGN